MMLHLNLPEATFSGPPGLSEWQVKEVAAAAHCCDPQTYSWWRYEMQI